MALSVFAKLAAPLLLLFGLIGVPLGAPPLPEDPLLAKIAPEQCLWYLSSAGVAPADANSSNLTERLLAEPELQNLLSKFERQTLQRARNSGIPDEEATADVPMKLVRAVLTRPFAAYISQVAIPGGPDDQTFKVTGGLVINLGDNPEVVQQALLKLETILSQGEEIETFEAGGATWRKVKVPGTEVAWSMRGKYFVLGIGKQEGAAILARAKNDPPGWLTALRARLKVERPGVVSYLNLAGLKELAGPQLAQPPANAIAQMLGLNTIQALSSVSGLEAGVSVTRTLLQTSEREGLLSVLAGNPLTAAELEHLPGDSVAAVGLRLNVAQSLDWLLNLIAQTEPRGRQEIDQVFQQLNLQLGFDFRQKVLNSLGDAWTVHASPADGDIPWTGVVASVTVQDHAALSESLQTIAEILRQSLPDPPPDGRRHFANLRTLKAGDETIYFMNIVERDFPFAPSLCLTKDRLYLALYPQSIKGQLVLSSADQRLPAQPEIARRLAGETPPTGLVYFDTRSLFRTVYPLVQIGMERMSSQSALTGFPLDLSWLPPARTIERHLQPTVISYARVSDGLEFTTRQTIPGASVSGFAPAVAGVMVPAVMAARTAARRNQDINTLKNLMLAMHNHHDVHNRLPSPQWGTNGNKGLSWRVAILPFIEEEALYQQFKHDEPWDSEHNLALIEKMPQLYRSAQGDAPAVARTANEKPADDKVDESQYANYRTRFLTLRHDNSVFPPDVDKGLGFRSITDGTSRTIAIVQAAPEKAVIWTKPDDLDFDVEDPSVGLTSAAGHFLAAFCDGHVRVILGFIDDDILNAMMTRNGGEVVELP